MAGLLNMGFMALIIIPLRLLALVIHEVSHGYISTKLGDPTPRLRGRLTLNPLAHLDFMGTLLMVLTGFGWARPVEVNPGYYKDRKKGTALVAFAGPLSNFLLAFLSLIVYGILYVIFHYLKAPGTAYDYAELICVYSAQINLCFMVFNLIPIPPLDGSRILGMFLSNRTYYKFMEYERYSLIIIMVLSLSGAFSTIIGNGVSFFYEFMADVVNSTIINIIG